MKELDLKNSFYISLAIHFIIFILFSIFFLKNPLQKIETPTVINIDFSSEISGNNADEKPAPVVEEKPIVKDKKTHPKETKKEIKNNETLKKLEEAKEKKEKIEKSISENKIAKTTPETGNSDKEDDDLLKNIDEAIKTGGSKNDRARETGKADNDDALSGGKWSGKARRTIFFPDIQSKLPDELRKKGIGYSVTARIKFDKNGLAVSVEIIKSSGNSKVDQIFNTELKKIRVEPSDRSDEVTHTFRILIK